MWLAPGGGSSCQVVAWGIQPSHGLWKHITRTLKAHHRDCGSISRGLWKHITWTVEAGERVDTTEMVLRVQANLCLHPRPVYEGFGICCQPAHGHADVVINLRHLFDAGGLLQAHLVLGAVQCSFAATSCLMGASCRTASHSLSGRTANPDFGAERLSSAAACTQQLSVVSSLCSAGRLHTKLSPEA